MTVQSPPEPFTAFDRRRRAAAFGMWVFLASEIIFFGGLFLGYAVYRYLHPEAFATAGAETDIRIGTANTALLLTSSSTMAVAAWAAPEGRRATVLRGLFLTFLLGFAFLCLKGYEYYLDFKEDLIPGSPDFPLSPDETQIFFSFYWIMTALHAFHLTAGLTVVSITWLRVRNRTFPLGRQGDLHVIGLYWHLIDLIWIFLFPLLYLLGR